MRQRFDSKGTVETVAVLYSSTLSLIGHILCIEGFYCSRRRFNTIRA
jgi:hypothetical protein